MNMMYLMTTISNVSPFTRLHWHAFETHQLGFCPLSGFCFLLLLLHRSILFFSNYGWGELQIYLRIHCQGTAIVFFLFFFNIFAFCYIVLGYWDINLGTIKGLKDLKFYFFHDNIEANLFCWILVAAYFGGSSLFIREGFFFFFPGWR